MAALDRCAVCGYAREGLPAVGRCPECGNEYGGEEILLKGEEVGGKWNRKRPGDLWVHGAAAAFLLLQGFFSQGSFGVRCGLLAMGVLMLGVLVVRVWQRRLWREGVMVYLSPAGYGQGPWSRGVGELRPWSREVEINLTYVQGKWWITIGKQFGKHVWLAFDATREEIEGIRAKLTAWQSVRVWVEEMDKVETKGD